MTREELSALRTGDRIALALDAGPVRGVVEDFNEKHVYVEWNDGGHGILRVVDDERITREVAP